MHLKLQLLVQLRFVAKCHPRAGISARWRGALEGCQGAARLPGSAGRLPDAMRLKQLSFDSG